MRSTAIALGLAALLGAAPGLASGPPPCQEEGPPAPIEPDEKKSDESDASEAPDQEGDQEEAQEELEGPSEEEVLVDEDLIIGLEPGGMPVVPEQQETKYGTDDVRRGLFLIGAGVGIGFFLPEDVNDYLEDWPRQQGGLTEEQGEYTEVFLNYVPRVTAVYIPIEYVQLRVLGEIGWSPKKVELSGPAVEDQTEWFHYVRYSVGALADFHLPVNANRQSIFVGGGVIYHWLRLEGGGDEFKADALGYRAQLGYRFYVRAIAPEVFVAFDYVKAETGKALAPGERDMVLEWIGGMLGGNLHFDLTSVLGAGTGGST